MNMGRAIALILLTGFLAGLTGIFWWLPNGLMAAALAMSLSLGTVWLCRSETRDGHPPSDAQVAAVGIGFGLLGGVLAALIQWQLPFPRIGRELDLGPPEAPAWLVLSAGVLYGLVLHFSVHRRTRSAHPLRRAIGSAALGCFAVRVFTGVCMGMEPIAIPFVALFGGVPFGVLWILATARLVPGWKKCSTTEPVVQQEQVAAGNLKQAGS